MTISAGTTLAAREVATPRRSGRQHGPAMFTSIAGPLTRLAQPHDETRKLESV